jgi:UDP-GlcNAc:undecaprenyl-phosphate GlcNAc-1-phosphate transferase
MFFAHSIDGSTYLTGYALSLTLSLVFTGSLVYFLNGNHPLAQYMRSRSLLHKNDRVNPFGGLAVIFSFLITLWAVYLSGALHTDHLKLIQTITFGVGLMALLGFVDDLTNTKPRIKLAVQVVIAIVLYFAGFQIARIGDWIELGHFSFIVTVLWVVGITNSLNLIDGQDGLASGIVFLSCLTLVFVYLEREIFEAPFLAVILAGSIFGFLIFNFPPAKIILGDTGSLPLGLMVSLLTLLPLSQGYTDEIYYLIPITTLILPITDTTFAFFRRIFKGISPFARDADHLHHRLRRLGLSPARSIFILFGFAFYFDLLSLVPTYRINLIPNFIPFFFGFVLFSLTVMILILRYYENKQAIHEDAIV